MQSFWTTRWGKYGIGLALAYGISVLAGGQMFSNELPHIIELGLVVGLFLLIIFGAVHLGLQFVGHLLISRFWPSRRSIEGIILNLPALIIFVGLFASAAAPWTQARLRRSLQTHFDNPLPGSIHVRAFQFQAGMDFSSHKYLISINPNELESFLTNSGYTALTNLGADFSLVTNRVFEIDGKKVVPPYSVFLARTNIGISHRERMIVVSTNRSDVAFSESFY
jgi:hypothetical protein